MLIRSTLPSVVLMVRIFSQIASCSRSSQSEASPSVMLKIDGIFGIKEATGNLERAQWLIKEAPAEFSVYSATT